MRIGIDIDETIAQHHEVWLDRYNTAFGDWLKPHHITDWDIDRFVKPACSKDRLFSFLTPDMYEVVEPYPGAVLAVELLRQMGHTVMFVSSCGPKNESAAAKTAWLFRHGFLRTEHPVDSLLGTQDKSKAPVDVLVDDHIGNLANFPGDRILINRPHNVGKFVFHHGRYNSLIEWAGSLHK